MPHWHNDFYSNESLTCLIPHGRRVRAVRPPRTVSFRLSTPASVAIVAALMDRVSESVVRTSRSHVFANRTRNSFPSKRHESNSMSSLPISTSGPSAKVEPSKGWTKQGTAQRRACMMGFLSAIPMALRKCLAGSFSMTRMWSSRLSSRT